MMERTGQVSAVSSRDFQSTVLWSFKLEGSDRFYRLGKTKPEFGEGQWIKFEERNGIVNVESITDAPTGAEAPPETAPATSVSATTGSPDVGKRIQLQAARADATRIVCTALENDHLPHASNVAKGKRLDLLLGYVDEVTKTLLAMEDVA